MNPPAPPTGGRAPRPDLDILRLRLRSVGRVSRELATSEPLTAILLAGGAAAGALWLALVAREPGTLAAIVLALVLLMHQGRRDRRFLLLLGRMPWRVYALEYVLVTAPVGLLLAAAGEAVLATTLPIAAVLLAALPTGSASLAMGRWSRRKPLPVPVPDLDFEWAAGLRRTWPTLLFLYILGLLVSRSPVGVVLVLFFITFICCGFYDDGEGWPLVQAFRRGPAAFLRGKVARGLVVWAAVASPLVVAFVIRRPGLTLIMVVALAGLALVLAGAILAKYATWVAGQPGGLVGAITPILLAGSLLAPPVTLFLLWRFARLAHRNLEAYLHAFT